MTVYQQIKSIIESLTQYVTVMACIAVDARPIFGAIYKPFSNETGEIQFTNSVRHNTRKVDILVLGLVDYGVVDSSNSSMKTNGEMPKVIIVSRSHAGEVRSLIEKAFKRDKYRIEAAGGAGYKVLSVLRGSAGE